MNPSFERLMRDATRLTAAGNLQAATAAIQSALGRRPATAAVPLQEQGDALVLDGYVIELPAAPGAEAAPPRPTASAAEGGATVRGSHTLAGLTRGYALYVPPGAAGRRLPLVVMLHGCTQNPDDFAAGTGMNALAREQGFLVLYPEQAQDANPSRCWNWFKHTHQRRGSGEAALIADMARAVAQAHGADTGRVYIAGLSAGGAMAGLVAAAHPEVFAAVGVHSGLAPGAARSLPEALAAMRAGAGGPAGAPRGPLADLPVRAIVFHGDHDSTVHPNNGSQVIAAALAAAAHAGTASAQAPVVEAGRSSGGQRYTRTVHAGRAGPAVAEHWVLHGAGHAWSGGHAAGSYTDPRGPDASREMLRFFFSQAPISAH